MSYEDGKKLKIFTGNANPKLAKEIADYLGLELGKAFVGKFNNGEIQIMVRMQDKNRTADVPAGQRHDYGIAYHG